MPTPNPEEGAPAESPEPQDREIGADADTLGTAVPASQKRNPPQFPPCLISYFPPFSPRPSFLRGRLVPSSEEQLDREMLSAAFSTFGWSTNFRLRSVDYSELMGGWPAKYSPLSSAGVASYGSPGRCSSRTRSSAEKSSPPRGVGLVPCGPNNKSPS